jgi:uncharacterized protein Veg
MAQLNEQFRRMQVLAGLITESQLNEGKYFTKYADIKKEIEANKGNKAIFKIEPEEKSTISPQLKPHLGKLVSIEASHGDGNVDKADTLKTYKENGDKIQDQSEVIKDLGEGGNISFLKAYAIIGDTDNPKKIKKQDGSGFEVNPNYDPNKLSNYSIIKKY